MEHMVGSRNIISKNCALVSNRGSTVRTNGEGITFLNSYKSDALRSKSKSGCFLAECFQSILDSLRQCNSS